MLGSIDNFVHPRTHVAYMPLVRDSLWISNNVRQLSLTNYSELRQLNLINEFYKREKMRCSKNLGLRVFRGRFQLIRCENFFSFGVDVWIYIVRVVLFFLVAGDLLELIPFSFCLNFTSSESTQQSQHHYREEVVRLTSQ